MLHVAAKKRILFINQHYYPDVVATAHYLTDLTRYLVEQGWEVSVIASAHPYELQEGIDPEFASSSVEEGVRVHRVVHTQYGRTSTIGRLIDYASFSIKACIKSFVLDKQDIVVSLTTPPLIGLIGTLLKQFKGSKSVIWSMDLHPEAEVASGMIRQHGTLHTILHALQSWVMRESSLVVALSHVMKKRIESCYPYAMPVITIPIWTDPNEIQVEPVERGQNSIPERFRGRFIVNYSGNLGLAHEIETICATLIQYRNDETIAFLFGGSGPKMNQLSVFAQQEKLRNVAFLEYVPRAELSAMLSRADVHWLTLAPLFEGIAVPSKTYGYLASGRPIIYIGPKESDIGDDIQKAQAGFIVERGNMPYIVQVMEQLRSDAALREHLGRNGRTYIEHHLSSTHLLPQWNHELEQRCT